MKKFNGFERHLLEAGLGMVMEKMKSDASKYTKGFGGNNMPKLGNFKMPKL